ncbi:MAG: hypothetical protein H6510_08695 [Acidobacteria bacterium]|nr:hypothetical protein [Acidobacteriota bacterium]MCB9397880.1 hypothetical protein [Acidobacteriota bacterium]
MSWNYRVIQTDEGYSVYEVYYDEDQNVYMWSSDPVLNFFCDSPEAIIYEWDERIREAFNKQVLNMADLEKKVARKADDSAH